MRAFLKKDDGQGITEYFIFTLVVLVITTALVSVWQGFKSDEVTQDSMLGTTLMRAPYTQGTSLGGSGQGIKDVLAH